MQISMLAFKNRQLKLLGVFLVAVFCILLLSLLASPNSLAYPIDNTASSGIPPAVVNESITACTDTGYANAEVSWITSQNVDGSAPYIYDVNPGSVVTAYLHSAGEYCNSPSNYNKYTTNHRDTAYDNSSFPTYYSNSLLQDTNVYSTSPTVTPSGGDFLGFSGGGSTLTTSYVWSMGALWTPVQTTSFRYRVPNSPGVTHYQIVDNTQAINQFNVTSSEYHMQCVGAGAGSGYWPLRYRGSTNDWTGSQGEADFHVSGLQPCPSYPTQIPFDIYVNVPITGFIYDYSTVTKKLSLYPTSVSVGPNNVTLQNNTNVNIAPVSTSGSSFSVNLPDKSTYGLRVMTAAAGGGTWHIFPHGGQPYSGNCPSSGSPDYCSGSSYNGQIADDTNHTPYAGVFNRGVNSGYDFVDVTNCPIGQHQVGSKCVTCGSSCCSSCGGGGGGKTTSVCPPWGTTDSNGTKVPFNLSPSIPLTPSGPASPNSYGLYLANSYWDSYNGQYKMVDLTSQSPINKASGITSSDFSPGPGVMTSGSYTANYTNFFKSYPYDEQTITANFTAYYNENELEVDHKKPQYLVTVTTNSTTTFKCTNKSGCSYPDGTCSYNATCTYSSSSSSQYQSGTPKSGSTTTKSGGTTTTTSYTSQFIGYPVENPDLIVKKNLANPGQSETITSVPECFDRQFIINPQVISVNWVESPGQTTPGIPGSSYFNFSYVDNPNAFQVSYDLNVGFNFPYGGLGLLVPATINKIHNWIDVYLKNDNPAVTAYREYTKSNPDTIDHAVPSLQVPGPSSPPITWTPGESCTLSGGATANVCDTTPTSTLTINQTFGATYGQDVCSDFAVDPGSTNIAGPNYTAITAYGGVNDRGVVDTSTTAANGNPALQAPALAPTQCSQPIVKASYIKVYGGDVAAGLSSQSTVACPSTISSISSWNIPPSQGNYGSGTTSADLATGSIFGFASGQNVSNPPPDPISFANDLFSTYGGNYSQGSPPATCNTSNDYYSLIVNSSKNFPSDTTDVYNQPQLDNAINNAANNPGYHFILIPGGGTYNVGGFNIADGSHIFIASSANIVLDNSMYYGNLVNTTQLPTLMLVAKGNVTINSNVSEIDGSIISEGGTINDCGGYTGNDYFDACNTPLTVRGTLTAKYLQLYRTNGNSTGTYYYSNPSSSPNPNPNAAESIIDYPQTWLQPNLTTTPQVNSIENLPPVI